MRGALPGLAFKQLRHRVQQEREEQAIGLGEIEGASGRLPLTERIPGARLQQESRDQPYLMRSRGRAVEDGRERGGRRSRVVLGEPQRIAKYAGASAAEVEATADEGVLQVWVRDDGRGGADFARGSGLAGLKDRIEALGGRISLHSPPGAGITLQIALPLSGLSRPAWEG